MNILWLTWKDHQHPEAGGAEVVLRQLSWRLRQDGHHVTWLTCGYPGAPARQQLEGIDIIRVGSNRYLHSFQALAYYLKNLRGKYDVIIEVVNTAPYFGVFFGGKARGFLFYHQLARGIWFYETKPPLSQFGYFVFEPLATRLLSRAPVKVITVSESTRADLIHYGFRPQNINIISEGFESKPAARLNAIKFPQPTILSFGAIRSMKRTMDQIEAFELAKKRLPDLQLIVAGNAAGPYGQQVLARIRSSPFAADIQYLGKINDAEKFRLMRRVHATMQTALKEGWGITIIEAASQGTPAVVYDVDGLRDSVKHRQTGLVTEPKPAALAKAIVELLTDSMLYQRLRRAGWQWSKQLTFDRSYEQLKTILEVP
ncbi:MAG TPA: glycosyltransferase family 4 protein [Candidatus Saccharimonadales bacterium]|nr:glycosyltransferase family 4 protein [Candidatus Saccharimonadales bacterium]